MDVCPFQKLSAPVARRTGVTGLDAAPWSRDWPTEPCLVVACLCIKASGLHTRAECGCIIQVFVAGARRGLPEEALQRKSLG